MSVKSLGFVTFLDVAKDGSKVAEVLTLKNSMLKDIPYTEMNEKTIHKESIRSYLPKPVYRKANQGLAPQKTGIQEATFTAAHFESRSQIDKAVAERGGKEKVKMNRWNQAQGHLQGMANEHSTLMIYGSPAGEGNKTQGLADVYYTVNTATSETAKQVVDAGGTGSDNTSIFFVNWGSDKIFGIYPAGTQAGMKRTDYSQGGNLVQIQMLDAAGNASNYYGYDEIFELDHGLVVKDFREASRVCNIDVSDLIAGNINAAVLVDRMIEAVQSGGGLTFMNYGGEEVMSFNGLPIRIQDSILTTEARVV
jgi:hypothetical protein